MNKHSDANINKVRLREKDKFGLRLLAAGVIVLFMTTGVLSWQADSEPVSIDVFPTVPKAGHPLLLSFKLNNPLETDQTVNYELYANGRLLMKGSARMNRNSKKSYVYRYPHSPVLGEKVTFMIKSFSESGEHSSKVNVPSYPPQVWSSFISFASFSTSLMSYSLSSSMGSMGSSISSMQFYNDAFVKNSELNVGLIFSMTLITLLVFLELSEPVKYGKFRLHSLRIRFGRLSGILFTVFAAMVLTKVVMIIG